MAGVLFTIGYQGASVAEVIAALEAAGVATLADVRALPWSRKAGFAKPVLAKSVEAAGLRYIHIEALGNPAKLHREAAPPGADWRALMAQHLDSAAARAALAAAAVLSERGPLCLMCYEADPAHCHRLIVAERLAPMLGAEIRHLHPAPSDALPLFGGKA